MNGSCVTHLPAEMQTEILRHIPARDTMSALLVCREWYDIMVCLLRLQPASVWNRLARLWRLPEWACITDTTSLFVQAMYGEITSTRIPPVDIVTALKAQKPPLQCKLIARLPDEIFNMAVNDKKLSLCAVMSTALRLNDSCRSDDTKVCADTSHSRVRHNPARNAEHGIRGTTTNGIPMFQNMSKFYENVCMNLLIWLHSATSCRG